MDQNKLVTAAELANLAEEVGPRRAIEYLEARIGKGEQVNRVGVLYMLCVEHMNELLDDEELASQIDFGSYRVQRDHDDQCSFTAANQDAYVIR